MRVLFVAGVSGNSKQRRRVVRLWQKMGYVVLHAYKGVYFVGVEK